MYYYIKLNVELPTESGTALTKKTEYNWSIKGPLGSRSDLGQVFPIMFVADLVPLNIPQLHVGL